ncbi:MAG: hypothetical protein WA941_21965 [Nitrososphaeraceae archaeon]
MVIPLMKVKLLATISSNLSYNTRNSLAKGAIVGIITAIIYLAVVVITTPNLPPSMAIGAALKVNGIIIIGLAIGVGIQVFASTYSKGLGCRLDERRRYKQQHKGIWRVFRISGRTGSSGSGGGTIMSSFLSFFSLVPLGCCGSWLFILSMLPSVFGGTVSVILIEYSSLLSYVGLVIVLGFAGLSILRLRKKLIERRMLEWTNLNYESDDNKSINTSTLESNLEGRGDVRY